MPQLFTRVPYTTAGTRPDFDAGRVKPALLVAGARQDDLQLIVEEGWLADEPAQGIPYLGRVDGTFNHQMGEVNQMRREVARRLDGLLTAAGATFGTWHCATELASNGTEGTSGLQSKGSHGIATLGFSVHDSRIRMVCPH